MWKKEETNNNLLLFYNTNHDSTIELLQQGFKHSIKGLYESGVYLTGRSMTAKYNKVKTNGNVKKYNKIVNYTRRSNKTKHKFKKDGYIYFL